MVVNGNAIENLSRLMSERFAVKDRNDGKEGEYIAKWFEMMKEALRGYLSDGNNIRYFMSVMSDIGEGGKVERRFCRVYELGEYILFCRAGDSYFVRIGSGVSRASWVKDMWHLLDDFYNGEERVERKSRIII